MKLLTAQEVAMILKVSPERVYELARQQSIPSVRIGERQVRFSEIAIQQWIERGGTTQGD
jgi:excisionase family DNA binding protein